MSSETNVQGIVCIYFVEKRLQKKIVKLKKKKGIERRKQPQMREIDYRWSIELVEYLIYSIASDLLKKKLKNF